MRLTKFTHSCVRLEKDNRVLVFDPGAFSEAAEALADAHSLIITHEHPDHVDKKAIASALADNADLRAFAPRSVIDADFADLTNRFTSVRPGQSFITNGFRITTHGGQHAVIHPRIPVIGNIGYIVDENVYHPGDSLHVPTEPVKTLLVPVHAPWNKISEVIDFVIAVRPESAHQVHDALLSEIGLSMVDARLTEFAEQYGVSFRLLGLRESVEV